MLIVGIRNYGLRKMKITSRTLKKKVLHYLQEEWESGYCPNLLKIVYFFKNHFNVSRRQILIALSKLTIKRKLEFERVYETAKKGTCRLFGYEQIFYSPLKLKSNTLTEVKNDSLLDLEKMVVDIKVDIDIQDLLEVECDVLTYLDDMHDINYVPTLDRMIHDFNVASKIKIFGLFYTLIYLYDSNEVTINISNSKIIRIGSYDSPSSSRFNYSTFIAEFFKFFVDEDFNFCWDEK